MTSLGKMQLFSEVICREKVGTIQGSHQLVDDAMALQRNGRQLCFTLYSADLVKRFSERCLLLISLV